jgi:hypothetical protein
LYKVKVQKQSKTKTYSSYGQWQIAAWQCVIAQGFMSARPSELCSPSSYLPDLALYDFLFCFQDKKISLRSNISSTQTHRFLNIPVSLVYTY